MKVILKPLSHTGLGAVVVTDPLFSIGRDEEPFASYEQGAVAHLSRRHARIFREGEGIYIADLGSRNGTRLNDKPVEFKPRRLLAGDRLSLAGHLDYEVEIRQENGDAPPDATIQPGLTLQPAEDGSPLEALAITRFPYLISKSAPEFPGTTDAGGDRSGYLSRRHAYIFSQGGRIFIEDLSSTNGTWLNGERLGEHAREIAEGDDLMFGGNYFSYRVKLLTSPQVSSVSSASGSGDVPAAALVEDECHTIFVSSAGSFLDIFCVESEEEVAVPQEPEGDPDGDEKPVAKAPARRDLLHKISTFSRELRSAFGSSELPRRSRTGWYILGVVVLVGAAAVAMYYGGNAHRDLERLLAQERYREAAQLANVELAADPGQEAIVELATAALTSYVLNDWLGLVEQDDYAGVQSMLQSARPLADYNPEAGELLDMLGWVSQLRQFIAERGGAEAPVQMYEQEQSMEALLAWWSRDPEEYRSRMGLLLNYVPAFKDAHALAFSQLRSLRYEKSVYLSAITKLDASIRQQLAVDQPEALVAEIESFGVQYPRLGGLGRVQTDLQHYLEVQAALAQGDRLRAALLIESLGFSTPPFQEKVEILQATELPSEAVSLQFGEASKAWRAGELARSVELLADLAEQRGGELAVNELEAKRRIIADYARLQQIRNEPDYGERLVNFYSALDPLEDSHFTGALGQQFQRHSLAARERAEEAWERSSASWSSYRSGGGIRGLLRLEEQISTRFGEQAGLLSEAYNSASYARQVYELLGEEYSEQRAELYAKVVAEMTLQRRSLQQLSMVLSPELLDIKLGMLAAMPTEQQVRVN
jgi:pSer/pThr/pTyr-binding forkhead associated (FHA) protein